jgi:hypothetical protein
MGGNDQDAQPADRQFFGSGLDSDEFFCVSVDPSPDPEVAKK